MSHHPSYFSLPGADCAFDGTMPSDLFIREKFTRDRTYARKLAAGVFRAVSQGTLPDRV